MTDTTKGAGGTTEIKPRNKGGRPRKVKPIEPEAVPAPAARRPMLTRQEVANTLNIGIRFTYILQDTDPDFPAPIMLGGLILRWEPADIDRYLVVRREKSLDARSRSIAAQRGKRPSDPEPVGT